jgi:hypothetical protein
MSKKCRKKLRKCTFFFLVESTWNGRILLDSRSQATASQSKMQLSTFGPNCDSRRETISGNLDVLSSWFLLKILTVFPLSLTCTYEFEFLAHNNEIIHSQYLGTLPVILVFASEFPAIKTSQDIGNTLGRVSQHGAEWNARRNVTLLRQLFQTVLQQNRNDFVINRTLTERTNFNLHLKIWASNSSPVGCFQNKCVFIESAFKRFGRHTMRGVQNWWGVLFLLWRSHSTR